LREASSNGVDVYWTSAGLDAAAAFSSNASCPFGSHGVVEDHAMSYSHTVVYVTGPFTVAGVVGVFVLNRPCAG
jgi:hypothetical protein